MEMISRKILVARSNYISEHPGVDWAVFKEEMENGKCYLRGKKRMTNTLFSHYVIVSLNQSGNIEVAGYRGIGPRQWTHVSESAAEAYKCIHLWVIDHDIPWMYMDVNACYDSTALGCARA